MDSFIMVTATKSYQLRINYSETKSMAIGKWITSPKFRVGGHDWTIKYFPQGNKELNNGDFVSAFLELQRESTDVSATFELALLDKNGNVSSTTLKKTSHTFTSSEKDWGWSCFIKRTYLEETYIKDGFYVFEASITLKDTSCRARENTGPVGFPRENIQEYREENIHTDVTFDVDGNFFVAHRLILAAHSPVFEAELFGSMAESNMDCIKINEMIPSVFKAMLDFMYSGRLPVAEELGDGEEAMSSTAFFQNLLAAADRYAVDNLKSMCKHKLVGSISLDTVMSLLELAEKHHCSDLKTDCLKFIVAKDNFVSLVLTGGYIQLMQNYPSLLAELKEITSK